MAISPYIFQNDRRGFYKVAINEKMGPLRIVAYMPENFTIQTTANFESRLGAAGAGSVVGTGTQATTGVALVTKAMTMMTWQSSDPIEFQLPLLFDAHSDPMREVHQPIAQLLALPLPTAQGTPRATEAESEIGNFINGIVGAGSTMANNILGQGLLRGPGPTFSEPNRHNYTLTIGNVAIFTNMIITSASVEMESLVNKNGLLLSAKVDVTMKSSMVYLREDILQAFRF